MGGGPGQVQAACEAALVELAGAFDVGAVAGSREEWAAAVGAAQRVINVAGAAQDAAIARLAAIEPQWCEDGTLVESHRGLGHVALDAPAIVSGVLACTARHAERRVRTAVRLAGDGPAGSTTRDRAGWVARGDGSGPPGRVPGVGGRRRARARPGAGARHRRRRAGAPTSGLRTVFTCGGGAGGC